MAKFMIDGIEVKAPHIGPQLYEWNRVSRTYNSSKADVIDKTIAQKDKFFWDYAYITADEMKVIEDIVKPRISNGKNEFKVTSWTPDRGFVTKLCYLGTPISYTPLTAYGGVPKSFKVSYHWIQIKGSKEL